MSEEEKDRRESILTASLRVFAREGYEKATIKKIASEASLRSPALLYWYFKNKAEIFQQTIFKFAPVADNIRSIETLKERPPDEVLRVIGKTMLTAFRRPELRRLLRIVVSELSRRPGLLDFFAEHGILKAMNALAGYLQHQVDLGRLKPHDTNAVARIFLAPLMTYVMWIEVMPPLGKGLPGPDDYLDTLIEVVLDGLRAD